jgi:hypothetical protein|tara:strand:- start:331 stop:492 length:162 start_codon:yes stop_codon:yes gene_type:complete
LQNGSENGSKNGSKNGSESRSRSGKANFLLYIAISLVLPAPAEAALRVAVLQK